ncbi:Uncharacterized protein BP5553_00357 [Venustampulla echinocandica]|uniref:Uncharacterized protein n=1 Tax=Venustampulla echinocandica TaxID=2656787 RepID=A0A370TXZ0_9HELO|nr:Uncharacterized protein BP5553_00357 [Venustampulla echinocandica]RDL40378.1 Uncharacterized protein BP5553_00357 [Venustampulla echinocandica]
MLYLLRRARIPIRTFNKLTFHRAHHSTTGMLITISPHGTRVAREIEIWLGDRGNAYVMFDPEISQAFQAGTILQGGCSLVQDQELLPLNFHHHTRHFSHHSCPYPRLEIPQDLPQQSNAYSSPATLHAFGVTHAITLDGMPDAEFQHSMRESIQRLQPVLDELKDT